MRCLTLLTISVSLFSTSCTTMPWIKEEVPDVPICRPLDERIQTKKDPNSGQMITLKRPNPVCRDGVKDKNGKVTLAGIGEPRCGYCVWTYSDREALVGDGWNHLLEVKSSKDGRIRKKKWTTVLEEGLILPAESQAWSKAFTINICNMSTMCSGEVDRWRLKFDALDSVGDAF